MATRNNLLALSNKELRTIIEQICYLCWPVIQFYIALGSTLPIEEHRLASRTANP